MYFELFNADVQNLMTSIKTLKIYCAQMKTPFEMTCTYAEIIKVTIKILQTQ